jgi:hypothetical protein
MKISRTHQILSDNLKNTEVLTNPEPFLGPNWETILRFWLYGESLTYEQKDELFRRYVVIDIDIDTFNRAWDLAYDAAVEVIGKDNWNAVYLSASYSGITMELIAMHLLFERGHSLTFIPLIKDL